MAWLAFRREQGHQAVVQRLLKAGADHDNSNNNGDVPLQLAAGQGHQAIVQCFLYAGADKDAADTLVEHYCILLDRRAIRQLYSACDDKGEVTHKGTTSLHVAGGHLQLSSAGWILALTKAR